MTDPATIAGLKVPLLGNFGGQDQGIPVERRRGVRRPTRRRPARASTSRSIRTPATAFASSKDPKVFRPADAKDADARTDAFFAKVLKGK